MGYVGTPDILGYAGYVGRTTSPKSAGRAAVFGAAPPNPRRAANGNGKQPAIQKKRMLIFNLNC